ncbi:MAG: hypothetical protein M1833_001535 [Piccolia ochrophora]|nr:MAG: hypothetical protein M1833_001535 [Piccolia ochrophora]
MLEYFTHKKAKKHDDAHPKAEEAPSKIDRPPVLTPSDENFLERIVSQASSSGTPPPLPTRTTLQETGDPTGNEMQLVLREDRSDDSPLEETESDRRSHHEEARDFAEPPTQEARPKTAESELESDQNKDKGKKLGKKEKKEKKEQEKKEKKEKDKSEKQEKKHSDRFSFLKRATTKKDKKREDEAVTPDEAAKEQEEMTAMLENLSLSATSNNKRVFSMSKESQKLVQQFTLILKDLVNGVPTAYDDLVSLFDNSQDQLQKTYSHMPPYLQNLVEKLPEKFAQNLGAEAVATASGAAAEGAAINAAASAGAKAGVKKALKIPTLKEIVMKQGTIAGILKAIMNFLKLRWPAFMGTSVLWSLGIFVLLLVLFYCHKRGREVRIAKEKAAIENGQNAEIGDDADRFEELPDDAMLESGTSTPQRVTQSPPRAASPTPVAAQPKEREAEPVLA